MVTLMKDYFTEVTITYCTCFGQTFMWKVINLSALDLFFFIIIFCSKVSIKTEFFKEKGRNQCLL